MAEIKSVFGASHTPLLVTRSRDVSKGTQERVFQVYERMGQTFLDRNVEILVVFGNDHIQVFPPDQFPALAIQAAPVFHNVASEGRMPDVKGGRKGNMELGFHLTDYDDVRKQRERWLGKRGDIQVTCNIQAWPADRRRRLERVRSRLFIERRGQVLRQESSWWFRTYSARQFRSLLRTVPQLEHVKTYDFTYDTQESRAFGDDQLDRVFERMYFAAELDLPGAGIIYVTKLDKAATFVPKEIIDRVAARTGAT